MTWGLPAVTQVRTRRPFWLSCLVFVVAALTGCFAERQAPDYTEMAPKDITETNRLRAKLGIRPIKDSWRFGHREFGEEKWGDQSNRLCKVVKRDDQERLAWEFDNYYSGLTFRSADPDSPTPMEEFLVVHYEYGLGRFFINYNGMNPATGELLQSLQLAPYNPANPNGDTRGWAYQGETDEATLAVADRVLAGWNLSRTD